MRKEEEKKKRRNATRTRNTVEVEKRLQPHRRDRGQLCTPRVLPLLGAAVDAGATVSALRRVALRVNAQMLGSKSSVDEAAASAMIRTRFHFAAAAFLSGPWNASR
jgi:hypothetical protein